MALEVGAYIGLYISEETNYGVPVAPAAANALQVVSFNFSDSPTYVADDTIYSPYPDMIDEEEGHSNASFEGVCHIPIANASNRTARTAFTSLMEAAFGKAVVVASSAQGVLPTYQSGNAFIGLSADDADKFELGNDPAENSFTIWKKTLTGHEVGVGCVITEVVFSFGLNQYVMVTFRGQCAEWAKFEPGTIKTAITAGAKTSFDFTKASGMIGKGAYVKVQQDSGTDTAGIIITGFDKANDRVTIGSTTFTATSVGKAVKDAMPAPSYTNRQFRSIWGDNIRVSLNGGANVIEKVSSLELTLRTGVQLFNEDNTSLVPTEAYMGRREVELSLNGVIDPDDLALTRAGFFGDDHHIQILAGGLTGATDGGRLLLQTPKMTLRRNAPSTPRDGMSTIQLNGLARGGLVAAGTYTPPLVAYIR